MEVRGVSGVASHGFGVPPSSITTRAFKIKSFKFHSSFKNVPHMRLVMSHKVHCYKANPMFWGREFQSRHKHLNGVAPYKWPCKHASALVVCSVSYYGAGNDVENFKSVEKKVKKDIKLPDSYEVESLIRTMCDTTSIAEFKLNLAGFNLYIKRNLVTENVLKLAPNPALNGIQRILDTATDEGLVILQSPMVGYFRRSRTIKGKRAPPSCKEKQEVKEGQVLCYVEQLGGEIPIESDVSGEVIEILRKDGEPVGYGDALIAILPSFPGIKKLQ